MDNHHKKEDKEKEKTRKNKKDTTTSKQKHIISEDLFDDGIKVTVNNMCQATLKNRKERQKLET